MRAKYLRGTSPRQLRNWINREIESRMDTIFASSIDASYDQIYEQAKTATFNALRTGEYRKFLIDAEVSALLQLEAR